MRTVLLVVHNRAELRGLTAAFQQARYEVRFATDGLAGLDAFNEHRPDAVVLNLLIPKLSGGELCRRIKTTPGAAATPVVLVSGPLKHADVDQRAREQWRADRVFPWKYEPADLVAVVDRLLAAAPPREPAPAPDEPEIVLPDDDLLDRAPRVAQIDAAIEPATGGRDPLDDLVAQLEAEAEAEARAAVLREEEADTTADDEGGLQGSLRDTGIPEIFAEIYFERKTGVLAVTQDNAYKNVYFESGRAIHVDSENRQESLGRILVDQGVISEADLMRSLEDMAAHGRRQGGALVELGLIDPLQLYQALRLQMREKLLNLFTWFEGDFFFDETSFDKSKLTVFELPMPAVIHDGIQRAYEPADVADMFAGVRDHVVAPADPPPFDRAAADLPEGFWRVFDLVDGRRTIAQVVKDSPFDAGRTYRILYAMLVLRLYDRVEPEAAAVSPPAPPAPPPAEEAEFEFEFDTEPAPEPAPLPPAAAPAIDAEATFEFDDGLESIDQTSAPEPDLVAIDADSPPPPPAPEIDPELARTVVDLYLRLEQATYYELLGLEPDASAAAVQAAYHALVKRLHEDKIRDRLSTELKDQANQVVQALNTAYETLANAVKRAEYDRRLTGGGDDLKERRITTILAAEQAFNQGMLALRRGAFGQADRHFGEACELFPEEAEYHAYFGWARFNNHEMPTGDRMTAARVAIERSIKINPKGDKGYFFLGKILLAHANKDRARQMFALAFRYNKNNADAVNELRRLQREKERERRAEAGRENAGLGDKLRRDVDLAGVKRALKKLFK